MVAEIVQATRREKLEFHFCGPLHLLVVYDQGMRRDGDTFVEGLPRSKLRNMTRKLAFVPAGIWLAVRLVPAPLMAEFRERAAGREGRPRSAVAAAVIVTFWLAAAAGLAWLCFKAI